MGREKLSVPHTRGTRRTRKDGARGRHCAHDKRQMAVHKDNLPRPSVPLPPSLPSSRRRGHFFARFGKIDADTLFGAVFQRRRKALG